MCRVDPLNDDRWDQLVSRHPKASLFHSSAWLRALQKTYGYQLVAFTWCGANEPLDGAILLCEVDSWLTGRRLVSLPFSDHCEPMLSDGDFRSILSALELRLPVALWRYIEVRPLDSGGPDSSRWHTSATYQFHRLDLRPSLNTLFQNFHHSSTRRKIRRAEREGLEYREGSNESLFNHFYRLLVVTRKRHGIPPQPRKWFRNLMEAFGEELKIRLAFNGDRAVAGMLTIRHKDTLYYKNGGSDERFHSLGGMHLLFWNAIQDAKSQGLAALDFGRVDTDQPGLITFKSRWGAVASPLHYYRFSPGKIPVHAFDSANTFQRGTINAFCSLAPSFLLPVCGSLLYKHIG
ncbi:MAG TPA: GNAT family N-acetyltransferase [Candidatus Dormibacteraeota bacterium]|nr:GNAT family N-acetyltransferase [Candidatus Dormibacteraeota bacterium]